MPINFSDLVAKVEAQNQQNRQQLVAQVMPAIDLMVKRREYDYENEQFASGLQKMATDAGMTDYTPDPTLPANVNQAMYSEARTRFEADKKSKAFYESTGQALPEGWDKLSPEARAVKAERDKQDYGTLQAIAGMAEAHPEVKKALEKVKDAPVATKSAIVDKVVKDIGKADEWEDWKKKANYSASLSNRGGGTSEPPELTVTQEQSFQRDVDAAWSKIADAANTGIKYTLGKETYQVKVGKNNDGVTVASYGKYRYDGKSYTKDTPEGVKKVLSAAHGKSKTLQIDYDAAVRRQRTAKGIPDTAQPKQQPNNTSQLKQMDKTVQSLIGKY